jgi:hypothetical protein
MHREFNSERLSESRSKAFKFLKEEHWGLSFTEIASKPQLDLESVPLWDVMRFYQRLAVAARVGCGERSEPHQSRKGLGQPR